MQNENYRRDDIPYLQQFQLLQEKNAKIPIILLKQTKPSGHDDPCKVQDEGVRL